MKLARICIAVLAVMTFASISAAQCGPQPKAATASDTESKIIAAEKQINDAIKNNDAATFKSLVAVDNAWVITPHGVAKVADVLQFIFDPNVKTTSNEIHDPKVVMLNPDTYIITYKSVWTGTVNGKSETETAFNSTVWVKRNGKWWAVFHQTTDMAKPENKPATTENK